MIKDTEKREMMFKIVSVLFSCEAALIMKRKRKGDFNSTYYRRARGGKGPFSPMSFSWDSVGNTPKHSAVQTHGYHQTFSAQSKERWTLPFVRKWSLCVGEGTYLSSEVFLSYFAYLVAGQNPRYLQRVPVGHSGYWEDAAYAGRSRWSPSYTVDPSFINLPLLSFLSGLGTWCPLGSSYLTAYF